MREIVRRKLQALLEPYRGGGAVDVAAVTDQLAEQFPIDGEAKERLSTEVTRAAVDGGFAVELNGNGSAPSARAEWRQA